MMTKSDMKKVIEVFKKYAIEKYVNSKDENEKEQYREHIQICNEDLDNLNSYSSEEINELAKYYANLRKDKLFSGLTNDSDNLVKLRATTKELFYSKIYVLEQKKLSLTNEDAIKYCDNQIKALKKDIKNMNSYDEVTIKEKIELYGPITDEEKTESTALIPVEEVITPLEDSEVRKNQDKSNKKIRTILGIGAGVILAALIFLVGWGVSSCSKQEDGKKNDKFIESSIDDIDENKLKIDNVDFNDYESLKNYAIELQKLLPENTASIDDIMYALRLMNFDTLENKDVFTDREEVCYSTLTSGKLLKEVESDKIIIKDDTTDIYLTEEQLDNIILCATDYGVDMINFIDAKTEKGYDIYEVAQICANKMYEGNETDVYYAKIFNDLMAREAEAFTVCANSPISTRYSLAGLYNNCSKRILELTSGIGLTSVYGDTARIDGYYGFTCVEELEAYMRICNEYGEAIGNENNMLYTDIIDDNITSYHR